MRGFLGKFIGSHPLRTCLVGALLGLGAPVGYFVFGFLFANVEHRSFGEWATYVCTDQSALLFYLTVPTMMVFATFGYVSGMQQSRLTAQARKMEEFLHIAAHDIRGPVANAMRAIELLEDNVASSNAEDTAKLIPLVGRQLRSLNELLTGLLDIYKLDSGAYSLNREPCDVKTLIERSADEISFALNPKDLSLRVTDERSAPKPLQCDPFKARQVFRNIMSNALRYAPEGSVFNCHIKTSSEGGTEITFHNDGPHLPLERLATLFDKFAQASNRDQKFGHGLGLTICKSVVAMHGGRIWMENAEPSGVTMHVVFPN